MLNTPDWLLDYIENGIKIPFEIEPPRMLFKNNSTVLDPQKIPEVRLILTEYLQCGFIEIVNYVPYCVLPLQLKESSDKIALIYDMSKLNDYVEKCKFKLESWPEMYDYATCSNYAVKFDLKKYYYQIDIHPDYVTYFGFCFEYEEGKKSFFVWRTMPYGYTRAPYIARQLMKPLISIWRRLGAYTVVFYDDRMVVSDECTFNTSLGPNAM
jgi:hypothetical protein